MLTALHVRNFILIDRLSLEVGRGMTALTGETGAGKSILLDALGLAVGARIARSGVRNGAGEGVVSAAFEPDADHPIWAVLAANGIAAPDGEVILRRVQTPDGRSRAFVNDQPVSVGLLRALGESLVEIHGQFDGRGFLTASTHRELLDEYGGLEPARDALASRWRAWREAAAALEERRTGRAKALAEADYLRHVVAELGRLDPQADEEDRLAERRAELQAAERAGADLAAAGELLSEDGLAAKLSAAARRLAKAAAQAGPDHPIAAALNRVETALSEALEARAAIEDAAARLGADPDALEKVEERLFALRAAARKHVVTVAGLAAFYRKASAALEDLQTGETGFAALESAAAAAEAEYRKGASALSVARREAARALDIAVAAELEPLKLGLASFETRVATDETCPMAEGFDSVEFLVRTNPGAGAGPLKTIASGGELSRFVLAVKAALAAKETRTVIIFDEVDAGVGGAVAHAVGERLTRLARDAQVLVVTHSPQVAARAAHHWRIEKTQERTQTTARVATLGPAERIEEIARMLSGAEITIEARAAAARLLGASIPAATKRRKRA